MITTPRPTRQVVPQATYGVVRRQGSPKINDDHFPPQPSGPLDRVPRARTTQEAAFLHLGEGARLWLVEAAAAGTTKMRVKMDQALTLAKLFDPVEVDWALGHAAVHGRFAEADLASILDRHATSRGVGPSQRAGEDRSLTQGTSGWAPLSQRTGQQTGQLGEHDEQSDEVVS